MKNKFKSILLGTVLTMTFSSVALAADKVVVLLEAPQVFCKNEEVSTIIDQKTAQLFSKDKFEVVGFADSFKITEAYRIENGMNDTVAQGRGAYTKPFRKENVEAFCKKAGANYVLYFKLYNDNVKYGGNMLGNTAKTNVICETRVLNGANNAYTFSKQIMQQGKSTAIYAGIPSFEHAYLYAFKKALELLTIDTNAL